MNREMLSNKRVESHSLRRLFAARSWQIALGYRHGDPDIRSVNIRIKRPERINSGHRSVGAAALAFYLVSTPF
jgi:hypothetical protein